MRSFDRTAALAVFLLLVLPLVIYCALCVPSDDVPDEASHVARAESLLAGNMIGYRVPRPNPATGARDAGVTGNVGLALAAAAGNGDHAPLPADASRAARLAWARSIPWQPKDSFVSCVNTAAYAPLAYIPAALGIAAAILMDATPHATVIAASVANALAFGLIGALALLLAVRGRLLLLVTLGLPMTVWLAGSSNQDGLLIACSTLAIALLTRAGPAAFWCGSAILAVLVLQKPPFVPLALLPILAAGRLDIGAWGRRIAGACLVALPGILWAILVMILVSVPLRPGGPYHPGPLWPGDPSQVFRSAVASAQMTVIAHHPLRVALLPVTGNLQALPSLWLQFIGVLGALTIRLPHLLYSAWSAAIASAIAAALARQGRSGNAPLVSLVAAIAILATMELIFVAQYLTWTPVGMAHVDGVQGRYFIPLLPVLLFVIPGGIALSRIPAWIWWIAPVAAILATDATLPALIQAHYYR